MTRHCTLGVTVLAVIGIVTAGVVKRPSVYIDRNRDAAFQTRRYGYSASLPIAVLTNFHQLAVYDCQPKPDLTDEAHVARILLVRYDEFEARFAELWPLLSTRRSIRAISTGASPSM